MNNKEDAQSSSEAHGEHRSLEYIAIDNLLLDPLNPRLVTKPSPSQDSLLSQLYDTEALDELASSFADNGYFAEEPLVVVPHENAWIVVEGNRRLATLKILLSSHHRTTLGIQDWPNLNERQKNGLSTVPCITYKSRDEVFPFLGFRHITGPKKWAPFQRARFIAQLIDDGRSLSEIEDLIGDTSQTVKKLYQDYVVYEQIRNDLSIPDRRLRDKFSLLEVTLGQRAIKSYLGMPRRLPTEKVEELIPNDRLDHLEEVIGWVFGTDETKPVISDSRAIANRLAPVLTSASATEHLRRTHDLDEAYEQSDGEKAYLLKRIQGAERALREVAALIGIYRNDADVIAGTERITQLTDGLNAVVSDE